MNLGRGIQENGHKPMRIMQFTTLNLFQSQLHKAESKGQGERAQK